MLPDDAIRVSAGQPSHTEDVPAETLGAQAGTANGEVNRRAEIRKLYHELGRSAHVQIPDIAINGIISRLPAWEYRTIVDDNGQKTRLLQRQVLSTSAVVRVPINDTQDRRRVVRTRDAVQIQVEDVTGNDLRYMLAIESQFLPRLAIKAIANTKESKEMQALRKKYKEERAAFHSTEGVYLHENDVLTDREQIVVGLLTHFNNRDKMAIALGVSPSTLSRILTPVQGRLGVGSDVELAIEAVFRGLASVDHIAERKTDALNSRQKLFLSRYFSSDPEQRQAERSMPNGTIASHWNRIAEKMGIHIDGSAKKRAGWRKHQIVLHALRDGLIQNPN